MTVKNAFESVKPRGPDLDIPAVPPRKTKRGKELVVSNVPRTQGGIAIKSRADSAATVDKRRRVSKGG